MVYNFCNCASSSTLISPDAILFYRALTCSSVVQIFSCRYQTCFSLEDRDGFTIGTYDSTELGSPEGSTEITTGVNLEGLLLGD